MRNARRLTQLAFLALTLFAVFSLGTNCEKWCPFGAVESAYTYLVEGNMTCSLAVSNFFALGMLVVSVVLVRRAFCGYVCPIGTISSWTRAIGRRLSIPGWSVGPKTDRGLSLLKYAVLALIVWATWQAGELLFRGYCPFYALTSRHGEDIQVWAYLILGAIVLVSLVVAMPFCRWFCPLAAVMNPLSRFGWFRIRREAESCRDCTACAQACPMAIPVDQLDQVRTSRCIDCFACFDACPSHKAGSTQKKPLSWGGPKGRAWPRGWVLAILLAAILGVVGLWEMAPLPSFFKARDLAVSAQTATVDLTVEGASCRGRANLLFYFLDRDDLFEVPGYLSLAVWPDPIEGLVRVTYDPTQTDADAVRAAIAEPYFEIDANQWRPSPFVLDGYDSFGAL